MSKKNENQRRRQIAEQFKTRLEKMLGRTIETTETWIPVLSKSGYHTHESSPEWNKFREDELYLQWHQLEPHAPKILVLSSFRHAHGGLDINAEDLWDEENSDINPTPEETLEGDKEHLVFAIKRRDHP